MNGLQQFRAHLRRLKQRRTFVRWQAVLAWGIAVDVAAFFVLFAIDYTFRLTTVPRACLLIATMSLLIWQATRHLLPRLSIRESLEDLALLLETAHGVDGDLIAALQFDSALQHNLGSHDLQEAVIRRAVDLSEELNYQAVNPKRDAGRASWFAGFAMLLVIVFWGMWPRYANAHWNRLWLGNSSYPTRTVIESVAINSQADQLRVVEGDTLSFQVECSGNLPNDGFIELHSAEASDMMTLVLAKSNESNGKGIYVADGPRIDEAVLYMIKIGDAETSLHEVIPIRRPLIELTIEATAPAYMHRDDLRKSERFVQVLEGSSVAMSVRCTNGKRLEQVRLELLEREEATRPSTTFEFSSVDDLAMDWRIEPTVSGLTRVVEEIHFRVVVTDEDRLSSYHPIEGAIRVKKDQTPTASLSTTHFAITAKATPTFICTAEDDFGIASMTLHARRAGGRPDEDASIAVKLPLDSPNQTQTLGPIRLSHTLDVKQLKASAQDKVFVWLEVIDNRGEWPGVSTLSEALELDVLDEQSVLDLILQSDAEAEQLLTDAIEKELGLKDE